MLRRTEHYATHTPLDPRWTFPLNSATLSIYIPYWIETIQKFKIHFLHLKYFLIKKTKKSKKIKKIISNLIWSFFKLQIRLEMILKDFLWRLIPCDETYHLETSPCHGSSLSWGTNQFSPVLKCHLAAPILINPLENGLASRKSLSFKALPRQFQRRFFRNSNKMSTQTTWIGFENHWKNHSLWRPSSKAKALEFTRK